jgi:hypothetical protein
MKRKSTMASVYPACPLPRTLGGSLPPASGSVSRSAAHVGSVRSIGGYIEGGHQLEKLEFALAVAMTRGDHSRIIQLRQQIAELGGHGEEPGT